MVKYAYINGFKLSALRQDRAMSQEALARILDVSKTAVSSWERTESARVYLKRLPQLADALGMTLEQLRREIRAIDKLCADW